MDLIQSTFIGAFELRKNLTSLLQKLQKRKEEIVVTQNGKPAAMLLSLEKYLEMKEMNEELKEALNELTNKQYIKTLKSEVELVRKGKGQKAEKVIEKF
ncbi:hypothetical protein A3J20_02385 [Candidatus Gottesmanbacteria bacterium RIFCSPLOWO2_02_FULL_42_29]|uniref:Antitoxin n=1 Tax=Candidatus Gottesmanbacteria bacterium RIFCSPLOWO2_01_FULL_42_22 TaxID=1798391 RepID=A0A1F6BB46_9BACT|nr:MAG: hypothetical protein A2781_05910 [Candidatus Gottesmanbacteria bacterium RIFCSPHIGHO2_01_FULL_42_27]OGG19699.1 MAG: hypothetical protein A3E72_06305 [Candidatus Gottesmanbacteria bacterium RIFCSPHIGHO2_12_FULL_43_26]OGG34130.1 MAG: hypothetical protein A2968_03075 [Candidatus Gottesmanbacteria bacterium RIFCSPLOWO2_01_FULL_42_22]OGG37906.1 MAG: hypothetical protein A3J20_02385 [Candidatus Gottesmanbacteria bacterium RIFCSPLOWO2_02_FULL_42_29]